MNQSNLNNFHNAVPSDYYHQGVNKNFLQKLWHNQRKKAIKAVVQMTGGTLLDLGSHGGYLTEFIAQQTNASKVIVVDISRQAINFIKKNKPDWHAICANIEKPLDIMDQSADIITSFDVFEHLNNPEKTIKEAKRILKPGGSFIIGVPNETLLWKIVWFAWTKFGPGKVWHEVHVQNYSKKSLNDLFLKYGFTKKLELTTHLGMYKINKYEYE
ncbi:class I SAM-dependent methyltransferase [Patescibacteria group bacterium]|nr:class I SAM-dependent methyltransferase [Patescibacteria group bacterium]MBU0963688.1 class I SAM-dependent methyltransferase [Patescibacteria group bacterium]